MDLLGFSLNLISLLAITLATGILVDDAIVEIENIVRHMRMGKTPYRAALEAADEIGRAGRDRDQPHHHRVIFAPASFMWAASPEQFFKQFGHLRFRCRCSSRCWRRDSSRRYWQPISSSTTTMRIQSRDARWNSTPGS